MLQTPQSKAYSANVRRMCLIDAIANNIKNPPHPCKRLDCGLDVSRLTAIVENEIRTHYRLKANYIRKQLDRWKDLDDGKPIAGEHFGGTPSSTEQAKQGSGSQSAFIRAADEVRRLLSTLESGEVPKGGGKVNKPGRMSGTKTKALAAKFFAEG